MQVICGYKKECHIAAVSCSSSKYSQAQGYEYNLYVVTRMKSRNNAGLYTLGTLLNLWLRQLELDMERTFL